MNDASDETSSRQDDQSVPSDEEKKSSSRRKPKEVKRILPKPIEDSNPRKRKLGVSSSQKGSSSKKKSSAVSKVSKQVEKKPVDFNEGGDSGDASAVSERDSNTECEQMPLDAEVLNVDDNNAEGSNNESEDVRKDDKTNLKSEIPQELSIRWLDLSKVPDFRKNNVTLKQLKDHITKMVDDYNEKNKKSYKNIKTEIKPEPPYELIIYKWKQIGVSKLQSKVEDNPEEDMRSHFMLFFFKVEPPRIISVTSSDAWHIVNPYIDYSFPIKVCKEVGDYNNITEITKRNLFGECAKARLWLPLKSTFYKTSCLYDLIESLTCRIAPGSRLFELLDGFESSSSSDRPSSSSDRPSSSSDQSSSSTIQPKKIYNIIINTGGIRIKRRIEIENYPKILNLFGDIMEKKDMQSNEISHYNGFEFLNFFQSPPFSKILLDKFLIEEIFEAYQAERQPFVQIRYKHLEDFVYCENFQIKKSRESNVVKSIKNPPEMEEILDTIMDETKSTAKINEKEAFKIRMKKARLLFNSSSIFYDEKLLDCIEGEYHHSNGESYFKIRNMWYTIKADHSALLNEDFIRVYSNALIMKNSDGWLSKSWQPESGKLKAQILENQLKKFNVTDVIFNCYKVRYVHGGYVKQTELVGEILKNEVFLENKFKIEVILRESEKFCEKRINEEFNDKDAAVILKELKKERNVLSARVGAETTGYYKVLNPFPYHFKDKMKEKYGAFVELLYKLCKKSESYQDEGAYNLSYLNEPNHLYFDKITPEGYEPCDIMKYTNEEVYLYQVKENLGQDTRVACSQILNAATAIRDALSTVSIHTSYNYLRKVWYETVRREALKAQLTSRFKGEEEFINLFRDRKLIFGYAYCPTTKQSFSDNVEDAIKIDLPEGKSKKELIEMLKKLEYLDSHGRLTRKFNYCTHKYRKTFKLEGEYEKYSEELYYQLASHRFSESSIAKIEIVRLARKIQELGFEFKICEIATTET